MISAPPEAQSSVCRACFYLFATLQELKSQGVAFLVAPYEADAQMAYLARSGQVQLVVTEDSDLLAYGCPRYGSRSFADAATAAAC